MSTTLSYFIEKNVDAVKSQLTDILAKEIKKPYVTTSWHNNELVIKIEKMGTSEIRIQLTEKDGKSQIQETKRAIAFMHKAFTGEVEKMVDSVLVNKLGAKKA